MATGKCLKDLINSNSYLIEIILLSNSNDLICKNIFCSNIGMTCLCKLEHSLSSPFIHLNKIKKFDLSFNNLISLPPSIEKMNNLNYLNLNGNKIIKLPNYIKNMNNLITVELNDNEIVKSFPSSLSSTLSYEDIKKLPDSCFQ